MAGGVSSSTLPAFGPCLVRSNNDSSRFTSKRGKNAQSSFVCAHTHQRGARTWKRNRNKAPVMSHLIFNLRRICRAALPRLLFFSLQWNCWTLFVDLNFPVHACIHARGWKGIGLGGYRRLAWRSQSVASFFETKKNGKKTEVREKKNYDRCGVEFPRRCYFYSDPLCGYFLAAFLFFISLSTESNSRIWIYYLLSSCITFRIYSDEKYPFNATLLIIFCTLFLIGTWISFLAW